MIEIAVENADVTEFESDVLALKYARRYYGVDDNIAELLTKAGVDSASLRPGVGDFSFTRSTGAIAASAVLFLGVDKLAYFRYQEIREFSRRVLSTLRKIAPSTAHVSLTLHGANYGLDEIEAFQSEIAGLLEAVEDGDFPEGLQRISIVELNSPRAMRLEEVLAEMLPTGVASPAKDRVEVPLSVRRKLRSVGYSSESQPHIFVAMPFAEEMDDIYHYGIQGAVRSAGFLCERADLAHFMGDIVDWVKVRIQSARLLVADLTGANPNVYLEVGYAWGCGIQTILLIRDASELKFDVRSQRCIVYKNIKDLEQKLQRELHGLKIEGGAYSRAAQADD